MAHILEIVALLSILGSTEAFWRMNCATVQRGRIDPIVSPGRISAHVHTLVGSSSTHARNFEECSC